MAKEYIVETAQCMCKFGTAPGVLKATNDVVVYVCGKPLASTLTLGNAFFPPGFGSCKKSWPSKPCTPAVTQWNGFNDGLNLNRNSNPLTEFSKGTCAMAAPDCISFQSSGQEDNAEMKKVNNEAKRTTATAQTEPPKKEVTLHFVGKSAKEDALSDKTKNILKEVGKVSGNNNIYITSTARTPYEQARIMYNNCKKDLKEQRNTVLLN